MTEKSPDDENLPGTTGKILIVDGPNGIADLSFQPHEVFQSKSLEGALPIVIDHRPDLVVYFSRGKDDRLEEHMMTWLIEGFRGRFLLFDTNNRVLDHEALLESQVVDEYFSGPVGRVHFLSILKSQISHDIRFASPRAMTTFDLFRNLFDRGLNSIFLFSEDLKRCLAANLKAEQLTLCALADLRRLGLRDLCHPDHWEVTFRTIRRAARRYYDAKEKTVFVDRSGGAKEVALSCGVFTFGRKNFVKIEVQELKADAVKREEKEWGVVSRRR